MRAMHCWRRKPPRPSRSPNRPAPLSATSEKLYRKAISELFNVERDLKQMSKLDGPTGPAALTTVVDMFKRREIYRHLSNAGDRVARAGESLHDIVVKMV